VREIKGPDVLVEEPSYEEVEKAIKELKNYKALGEDLITVELIKNGGKELWIEIYVLLKEIWKNEEIPVEWNSAIIQPIHKKDDRMVCQNYRGILLLNVTHKIMSRIIAYRLTQYTEEIIGGYQCGFRCSKLTVDHIFVIRNILEKCYEYNIALHQLFIDFKHAYDSVRRDQLFDTMREFGISRKLIWMVKMTLSNTTA
jgi:sorting nexin-29